MDSQLNAFPKGLTMASFFGKFTRAARTAAKAVTASKQIHSYELQGTIIICPHCKNYQFDEGSALLNTAGMTFLNLDWANRSAAILACKQCGQVQWFLQQPVKISNTAPSTETK